MSGARATGAQAGADRGGGAPDGPGDATAWLADAARLLRIAREAAEDRWSTAAPGRLNDLLVDAGHAPQCRACPLCQGVVVLRQLGPDLLEQVSRATAVLAASLRAGEERDATSATVREPSVPRTEHIDITD